ncbi:Fanconi-associated nuclease 1 [Andreprevotia sp. IGB-42]|uniref:VRR-NUC domain-containing protein n=1 Tax=Andreprevotia sp. IGB-42 TaxID=2497473 RepID=UPI00157F3CAC|nr:VRR-NUC domain-containing protein [Andreprevotia sp. IGB-42]KAF0811466.1 Fanconi-associated nuclease 1 [Andreprevotia sp. IGB-42]
MKAQNPAAARTLEDPLYYLANFRRMLAWISARHADLLNAEETGFIARFCALPQAAQALLVRMVMRKGTLFRSSKLAYAEIGCPHAAAAPLLAHGWVDAAPLLDIPQLFGLLTKSELQAILPTLLPRSAGKAELLAVASQQWPDAQHFATWWPDTAELVYELKLDALCERLRLMFFGNLRQDWSDFVLADLGVYVFEPVAIAPESRGFQCRADVDVYLQLARCREQLGDGAEPADVLATLQAINCSNDWLHSRHARLRFLIGQQQERNGALADALHTYASCPYPGARWRAIRVLEKLPQPAAAHALAQTALAHPENDAETQQLLRALPRLQRTLGLPLTRTRAADATVQLALSLPQQPVNVEAVVRDHLHADHAPVIYVENTLFNALLGLLCWEAIFHPLPGAFFHPYHHGPADLGSADFVARRQALFDTCLARLDDGNHAAAITRTYHAKRGVQSPFVAWQVVDEALLALALRCIPAAHLKAVFARMLQDIPANRTGLPDLIRFWPDEARYQLIEVKGPGDRLQDNQRRWLAHFSQHDIPVAVCYLRWADGA